MQILFWMRSTAASKSRCAMQTSRSSGSSWTQSMCNSCSTPPVLAPGSRQPPVPVVAPVKSVHHIQHATSCCTSVTDRQTQRHMAHTFRHTLNRQHSYVKPKFHYTDFHRKLPAVKVTDTNGNKS